MQDIFSRFLNLPTEEDGKVVPRLQLLWTLFIVAKAELLGPLPDLVSSFNLLVCVSNVILTHLPKDLCKLDLSDKVGNLLPWKCLLFKSSSTTCNAAALFLEQPLLPMQPFLRKLVEKSSMSSHL